MGDDIANYFCAFGTSKKRRKKKEKKADRPEEEFNVTGTVQTCALSL